MSVLSDELANDPNAAGYSTMTDIEAATTLNLSDISINRATMSGSELLDNTDSTEYNSLTNVKRDQWLSLCGVDSIDPFGSVVQIVVNIWGGKIVQMTPDEYLNQVRPLEIEEISRENIDDLKEHILSGGTLDPLVIYEDGKEDGRHRANAAKELGIKKVPVIVFGEQVLPLPEAAARGPRNVMAGKDISYQVEVKAI